MSIEKKNIFSNLQNQLEKEHSVEMIFFLFLIQTRIIFSVDYLKYLIVRKSWEDKDQTNEMLFSIVIENHFEMKCVYWKKRSCYLWIAQGENEEIFSMIWLK